MLQITYIIYKTVWSPKYFTQWSFVLHIHMYIYIADRYIDLIFYVLIAVVHAAMLVAQTIDNASQIVNRFCERFACQCCKNDGRQIGSCLSFAHLLKYK